MSNTNWTTFVLDLDGRNHVVQNHDDWQRIIGLYGYKLLSSLKGSMFSDPPNFGRGTRHGAMETLGYWLRDNHSDIIPKIEDDEMPTTCKLFGDKTIGEYSTERHSEIFGSFLFWLNWKENEHLFILGDDKYLPTHENIIGLANYFNWPLPGNNPDGVGEYKAGKIKNWTSSFLELSTPNTIKPIVKEILCV
jgi:hypothetical protein